MVDGVDVERPADWLTNADRARRVLGGLAALDLADEDSSLCSPL